MTRDQEILAAFATGRTLRSIGAEFGISGEWVRQIAAKHGQRRAKSPHMGAQKEPKPMSLWHRPVADHTWRRVAALRELGSLGCWKSKAGDLIGVSQSVVSSLAGRYDLEFPRMPRVVKACSLPPDKTTSPMRALIAQRYAEGVAPRIIAAEVGKTPKHVMVIASQMGITRGRSDAAKYSRGFEIPDDAREAYFELGRKKRMPKSVRAEVLGLVTS